MLGFQVWPRPALLILFSALIAFCASRRLCLAHTVTGIILPALPSFTQKMLALTFSCSPPGLDSGAGHFSTEPFWLGCSWYPPRAFAINLSEGLGWALVHLAVRPSATFSQIQVVVTGMGHLVFLCHYHGQASPEQVASMKSGN